jgi:CheY-like chemotaxis protein
VHRFSKLLVIAQSAVFRDVLARVLRPHADQVLTAPTVREGSQRIAEHADLSLVLSESLVSDGDGFQVLEYVASLGDPKPRVILVATRPVEEEARRAIGMGAIGYLGKPIALREIDRLWKESEGLIRETATRVRSLGKALLIDPSRGAASEAAIFHLAWDIRNLSLTGAFLETKAPIPVHTVLHLVLSLAGATGHVKAEVIRVQEPSWRCAGGVGIVFREFTEGTKELLADYVALATRSPAGSSARLLEPSVAVPS